MELTKIIKALGDDTRLRILNILRNGSLCVCEIEAILDITQSNTSRHLNKLMNAKLVTYYKKAKFVYYKLDEKTIIKHPFIKELLDTEMDKEDLLKYDFEILLGYKNSGLHCDNTEKVKEVIEKISLKKTYK